MTTKQHGKWEVTQKQLRALKRRVSKLEKLLAPMKTQIQACIYHMERGGGDYPKKVLFRSYKKGKK